MILTKTKLMLQYLRYLTIPTIILHTVDFNYHCIKFGKHSIHKLEEINYETKKTLKRKNTDDPLMTWTKTNTKEKDVKELKIVGCLE